jgi:hypothetical protein
MGGSAGDRAETGGVRLFVDNEEREEFELPNSGNLRLAGESDSAKPDFKPCDLEIEVLASRLC